MKKQIALAGTLLALGVVAGGVLGSADSQAAAKYTITKSTQPCNNAYRRLSSYNSKTRNYYTIKSYLERLKSNGGGILVLKKGTYKVCSTLVVPSNVTIQLKKGTKIKKTDVTGSSSLKATKTLFKLSNEKKKDYKGTKKVSIIGANNVTIDLGKVSNAVGIDLGHNYNVNISKIKFRGKKGGTYINIAGSKRVRVEECTFANGETKSGDKFKTAITLNALSGTPCENIKITSNTFRDLENGVASTKYKKSVYSTKISIRKNTFTNMGNSAASLKMCSAPVITSNTIKGKGGVIATSAAFKMYSVNEPDISNNSISDCRYAIYFSRAASIDNVVGAASISGMQGNTVSNLSHYYVPYNNASSSRLFYYQTKADNNFTITTTSKPYREHYEDQSDYTANSGQAMTYFMLRSYMEQLEYAGGGTITIAAGTYTLSHSVCIPSNVTVNLSDGVRIQKVKATNTNLATNKTMLEIVPPSKEGVKNSVSGYNGSQNVVIQGTGSAILDCNNIVNAMAVVMGHANNVTIRNVAFTNEYGSHFIEANSSQNVTIENCSFTDFRIYDNKSHKEAINIDTTDSNNNGFNYEWSTHDRTACNRVTINNCIFTNMGVAVGSHTYSVDTMGQQIYHENVTIQNCKVNQTYNAAIRMWNWRNAVIQNNSFLGIQGLEDNKGNNYTCILVKGAVNPTITKNTFSRTTRTSAAYAIRVEMLSSAVVEAAVNAGYGDTICQITPQNIVDMKNNTVLEGCNKRFRIVNEDGSATFEYFDHYAQSAPEGSAEGETENTDEANE